MPALDTNQFFSKIASKDNSMLRISGIQNGKYILMADYAGETYIHTKKDGRHIEYRDIEEIFKLIQIETRKTDVIISLKNWESH